MYKYMIVFQYKAYISGFTGTGRMFYNSEVLLDNEEDIVELDDSIKRFGEYQQVVITHIKRLKD